jgi:hypothetical protein
MLISVVILINMLKLRLFFPKLSPKKRASAATEALSRKTTPDFTLNILKITTPVLQILLQFMSKIK